MNQRCKAEASLRPLRKTLRPLGLEKDFYRKEREEKPQSAQSFYY
jgi:hypothetical protein